MKGEEEEEGAWWIIDDSVDFYSSLLLPT